MKSIFVVLAFMLLAIVQAHAGKKAKAAPAPVAAAPVCAPLAPLLEKAKEHRVEFEYVTEPKAVKLIAAILKANAKEPFPTPTAIVVVFVLEQAHIGIVVDDKVCAHLVAPADAFRDLVRKVHGISIRNTV